MVDTTLPVITLNGDANITHEAGDVYMDANASWTDLVDGKGVVVTQDEVKVDVPGLYVLSYNYTDSSGNVAEEWCVRSGWWTHLAGYHFKRRCKYYPRGRGCICGCECKLTDLVDGNGMVVTQDEVKVDVPGVYDLSYNYTDSSGNVAEEVVRTVRVVDTQGPVIKLIGPSILNHPYKTPLQTLVPQHMI